MNPVRRPIVVVGSVTMDMVTLTPQIPRIGQTVIGTSFGTTPGGKGANQAVAAARLGYPVQMVGKVGDDQIDRSIAGHSRLCMNLLHLGGRSAGIDAMSLQRQQLHHDIKNILLVFHDHDADGDTCW